MLQILMDNILDNNNSSSYFIAALKQILKNPLISSIGDVLEVLSKYGRAALILLFSLPFCLPIPLPGVSTPFGIILVLLGLQMAFYKTLWLPKWILEKEIPRKILKKTVHKTIQAAKFLQRFLRPRLGILTKNKIFIRLNGFLVAFLSLILAIPIPIPFTNFFTTLPMIFISLGMLEDDGVCILISYFLTLVCIGFFIGIVYFGLLTAEHIPFFKSFASPPQPHP